MPKEYDFKIGKLRMVIPPDLNERCALQCEGYVRAGIAPNGTVLLHPPGERNRSVPVPAYTESWDACMRLVRKYRMEITAYLCPGDSVWGVGAVREDGNFTMSYWCTDGEARQAIATRALKLAEQAVAP